MKSTLSMCLTLAATLGLGAAACNKGSPQQPPPPAPTAVKSTLAPGVKPGSHMDWCEEHQVPESLCTRCNPSLIPAFKATGDWCPEHNLPESQCLICNPTQKIERPPREAGGQ